MPANWLPKPGLGRHRPPLRGPRGVVEMAQDGRLVGWAHDPDRPFRRLAVIAMDGAGCSARAVADIYRADLRQAGLGDGHAGFAMPLGAFGDARRLELVLEASGLPLQGSPVSLEGMATIAADRVGSIAFGLDPLHLSGLSSSGWAIDRDEPDRPVLLALRSGEATLREARATRFRRDRAAAAAEPFCGFVLDWTEEAARPLTLHDARSGARLARLR